METQHLSLADVRRKVAKTLITRTNKSTQFLEKCLKTFLNIKDKAKPDDEESKSHETSKITVDLDEQAFITGMDKSSGFINRDDLEEGKQMKYQIDLVTQMELPASNISGNKESERARDYRDKTVINSVFQPIGFQRSFLIKWLMKRGESFKYSEGKQYSFDNLEAFIKDNAPSHILEITDEMFLEDKIPSFTMYKETGGVPIRTSVDDAKKIIFNVRTYGKDNVRRSSYQELTRFLRARNTSTTKGVSMEFVLMSIMMAIDDGYFKEVKKEIEFLISLLGRYILDNHRRVGGSWPLVKGEVVNCGRYNDKTKVYELGWDSDVPQKIVIITNSCLTLIASTATWSECRVKKLCMITAIVTCFNPRGGAGKQLSASMSLFTYANGINEKDEHSHPSFPDFKPEEDWIHEAVWQRMEICTGCEAESIKLLTPSRTVRFESYITACVTEKVGDKDKELQKYVPNLADLMRKSCRVGMNYKAVIDARALASFNVMTFTNGPSGAVTYNAVKKATKMRETYKLWRENNVAEAHRQDEEKFQHWKELMKFCFRNRNRQIGIDQAVNSFKYLTSRSASRGTVRMTLFKDIKDREKYDKLKQRILAASGKLRNTLEMELQKLIKDSKPIRGTSTSKTVVAATMAPDLDFKSEDLVHADRWQEIENDVLARQSRGEDPSKTSEAWTIGERQDLRKPRQIYQNKLSKYRLSVILYDHILQTLKKPTINFGAKEQKAAPRTVFGDEESPPSYMGVFDMIGSETSIISKVAQMPLSGSYFTSCCDWSEYDKTLTSDYDSYGVMIRAINELLETDDEIRNDPFLNVPLCTLDGEPKNYIQLMKFAEEMARGQYYIVKSAIDEYSLFVNFNQSGELLTLYINSAANAEKQIRIREVQEKLIASPLYIIGAQIIGDDCITVSKKANDTKFNEDDYAKCLNVYDQITDMSGMSVSSLKTTCGIHETAKNGVIVGQVYKTRRPMYDREKAPRNELTKTLLTSAAIMQFMVNVRNSPTVEAEDFLAMLCTTIYETQVRSKKRVTFLHTMTNYVTNDKDGPGVGFVGANDETMSYLATLHMNHLASLLLGTCHIFRERVNTEGKSKIAESILDLLEGKVEDTTISFESDAVGDSAKAENVQRYLHVNNDKMFSAEKATEDLMKTLKRVRKNKTKAGTLWMQRVEQQVKGASYTAVYKNESAHLAAAIKVPNEVVKMTRYVPNVDIRTIFERGRSLLNTMVYENPIMYKSTLTYLTAESALRDRVTTQFPMGCPWLQSLLATFGPIEGKPGRASLMPNLQSLLSKLNSNTGHYIPVTTFLSLIGTIMTNVDDMTTLWEPIMYALYGNSPQVTDASVNLSAIMNTKLSWTEYTESSTVLENLNVPRMAANIHLKKTLQTPINDVEMARMFVPMMTWLTAILSEQVLSMSLEVTPIIVAVRDYNSVKVQQRVIQHMQDVGLW